jgi:hypothetical protein
MNVFGLVGNLLLLGALGCGGAAAFVGGDARGGLIITGISLLIPALILRGVGSKLGSLTGIQPDYIEHGTRGIGTITSVGDTGVTINNDPVLAFGLDLQVPGSPASTELRQRMPRFLLGAVLPGAEVDVVADPDNPTRVAIDWTVAPRAGVGGGSPAAAVPGPGMEKISENMGEPVTGVSSAAETLRTGRRGTAVVRSAKDAGDISDLGVVDASDAGRDDRIYVLELDVKLPGRSPYVARVGHRVPERLFGKIGPGMSLDVAVDRDDDQGVAIDWTKIT